MTSIWGCQETLLAHISKNSFTKFLSRGYLNYVDGICSQCTVLLCAKLISESSWKECCIDAFKEHGALLPFVWECAWEHNITGPRLDGCSVTTGGFCFPLWLELAKLSACMKVTVSAKLKCNLLSQQESVVRVLKANVNSSMPLFKRIGSALLSFCCANRLHDSLI